MKFLPLLWAALRRKTARSIFTLLSVTVAFLLFGMMSGISASFGQFLENIPANRIMVTPRFAPTGSGDRWALSAGRGG